jgi:hypothetical protein
MKKIKLLITFLSLVLVSSCTDDGGKSKIVLQSGAVPLVLKNTTGFDNGINFIALSNGLDFNLSFSVDKQKDGDVQSMDIVGFYKKAGVVSKAYLRRGVTTFPTTVTLNKAGLLAAFDSLNVVGDIQPGDDFVVSAEVTSSTGVVSKVFKDDGSTSIGGGLNSIYSDMFQKYDIVCPYTDASIFNGNYKVVADGWEDYTLGTIIPVVYTAANGLFEFRIPNTTRPGIINGATSYLIVVINPTDDSVSVTSNEDWSYPNPPSTTPFVTTVTGDGSVNACTGAINLILDFSGSVQNKDFKLVRM